MLFARKKYFLRFSATKSVDELMFHTDEHTTATNGRYELREALEQEFKFGTYNHNYMRFFPPIFPDIRSVNLDLCNSANKPLIRASDIIANRVYHLAVSGNLSKLRDVSNLHTEYFP